jgi:capsular polysaccharide biosynthesis protein
LDEVTQRLAQSSLESLTQQTNVVQLTTASVPHDPSSPKMFLILILAVFLGGIFGIGAALAMEMSNRIVREDEDMLDLLGVPLLGKIRYVPVRASLPRANQAAVPARLEPSVV